MAHETELKFAAADDVVLPDLGGVEGPPLDLTATYYDTADLRLAREGITLRERECWTVKLPVGPNVRDELEVGGLDEARELLTGWLRGAQVAPVATLRTHRRSWLLDGAEVVDDTVEVVEGDEVTSRFREIEVEVAGMSRLDLDAISVKLTAAGAVAGEFVPKAVRALGPAACDPPDLPLPEDVSKSDPAADAVALSLRTNVRRLLVNDVGVRLDRPDAVHQMRVACRRMRSDLRTFGPLVDPGWADPLREELAWLAGELGAARDLEVLIERLDPPPGIRTVLDERQAAALERGAEALRSPRYVELVSRLVEAARTPPVTGTAALPCREALPPLVGDAWEALARKARRLKRGSPAENFHRARIFAKRSRYAAEAVAPILGKRPRKLAEAVTRVQEVLGEAQDAAIAEELLAAVAAEHPELAFEAGRLAERQARAGRKARAAFFGAWKRADRPKLTRWQRC